MPCPHHFITSDHPQYLQCRECKSYRSTAALPPEELYGPDYWSAAAGHSTIREQVYNCDTHQEGAVTKYGFALRAIEESGLEDRSAAIEIGCAPGRLLLLLRGMARFHRVVGVEVDRAYEADIREIGCFGGELVFGLFPEATAGLEAGSFSLFTALDVFEHVAEPEAFLAEAARLLKPGGLLLLMAPLVCEDGTEMDGRFFEPAEHVWVHSRRHVEMLLAEAGFGLLEFSRWCPGHDVITARKAAGEAAEL
jgi:SAM-dependent methyltransferase